MDNIRKTSVLIVDDEKANLEDLISMLSPEYRIYMTKNGSSAIELANKFLPDIILLDILMPGMNGFDVLTALKASGKTQNIPVIIITGLETVADREKVLALGAVDCIHKPFDADIVKSRIRKLIPPIGKVLVADDMDMSLYVMKEILTPYGLQIDTVTDGLEAVEKVKQNVYDLVFMDNMMPTMNGIEATQEIRKLGGDYKKLPIIALTATMAPDMREMFMTNGFNDYLSKPINRKEVDEVLKKWIPSEKIRAGEKKN